MAVKRARKSADLGSAVAVSEPKKTVKAKKAAAKTSADTKPYVVIDHPVNGEIVSGLHYAIRIGASDNGVIEISFNSGEWQPCRSSAGYWWFDWGYFTPGVHKIAARIRNSEGSTLKKTEIKCEVR